MQLPIEQQTGIIYTSEAGKGYTYKEILQIAKGNPKLAQVLYDLATGEHIETVFERLLNEGEIDEQGNIISQE